MLIMRLLIVEDSARLAALMAKLLVDDGHTVDVAGSLDEAHSAIRMVEFDVVILDLSLPDGDGRDIINALRNGKKNTLVLVATARGDVVSRVQALNAGADDYVVKPVDGDELIARVRALGRRAGQIQSEVLACGNLSLDKVSHTLRVEGRLVGIPPRELSALSVLLSSRGQVLRREKLEQAIYTFDDEVSENAVEATVSRLRRRLETLGATVDIVAMRGIGYVLTERVPCQS
jgi:DNA-binding response OmpR family regulator